MSKSWRLTEIAAEICGVDGVKVEELNLSRLAAEYGRHIHPCKACFSTAPALCHWPCSCYPNYALGQTQDMMNDIYPLWVRARSEEHTSELQSLMRTSYAVFCLKKKTITNTLHQHTSTTNTTKN